MIRFLLPAMAVLKWRETRRFVTNLRVGVCSCRSRFDSSPPNGWKLFFLHGGGSAAQILESKNKSLAEHQNPDTLKRLNEANRAKKICRINSISIPLLVRQSVKKLFKEQEYHDAVRHHTEAIQRNPKEPTQLLHPWMKVQRMMQALGVLLNVQFRTYAG
ncbi:hypothetical protein DY000_02008836 [Brassica cretica]|uniref:Uncharacterized protein n=1 Tax=Brassica cretica TaxID=69181 RepID=A0ABQ7CKY8_BRACR|nr:hypothetical protein DY000_02008836 [Brassica cretica]